MKTKPKIYKRFLAYVIDYIIITLLAGVLSLLLINSEKYNEDTQKVLKLTEQYVNKEIELEEYQTKYNEYNYDLTLDSVGVTGITIGVTVIYFVVMCYFCHGITLGKYIMKIKIVSANDKDLNILHYFLRSLIVNSLLSNIVIILMVKCLSKQSFISSYTYVSDAFSILLIVTFIFMIYREDGRGLHDLLGNTKVVSISKEKTDEVEDANIIKETKEKKK